MKRDKTGKFTQVWAEEPKHPVKLSLTRTAWQLLEQQAQALGISRSEWVERQARGMGCDRPELLPAQESALLGTAESDANLP